MNKQAQVGIGALLAIAVGVIVALVIFQASGVGVGQAITTQTMNRTFTAPAANVTLDLQGQELLSTPLVSVNETYGAASNLTVTVNAANYTIAETISSADGLKRISYKSATNAGDIAGKTVRVYYTYGPEGYIDDAGGRSIAGIILLLAAIGIAIYALSGARRLD